MRSAVLEADRSRAERYSLLDVLGWATDEVRTHSAFLVNLLDPQATHAQGDLFLRRFIEAVVPPERRAALLEADTRSFAVEAEAGTEDGYIDILLQSRSREAPFRLIIENKAHAR